MSTDFPYLGSCSTGTLRPQDLIPSFCELLTDVLRWVGQSKNGDCPALRASLLTLEHIEGFAGDDDYYDSDQSEFDFEWLIDTLNEHAPEGILFSSHEGDGSDFGYWDTNG